MPQAFTTDRSVTGALRIAKEIATNPTLIPYLVNGLGIIKDSVVPDAPDPGIAGDVVWVDTSKGLAWTFDTTANKWISPIFQAALSQINASTDFSIEKHIENPLGKINIKIDSIALRWNVRSSPNDSGNRWSFQPQYKLSGSSSSVNIGASVPSNPDGYTVGTNRTQIITVNQDFAYSAIDTFLFSATKTGSPGEMNATATFNYRFYAN